MESLVSLWDDSYSGSLLSLFWHFFIDDLGSLGFIFILNGPCPNWSHFILPSFFIPQVFHSFLGAFSLEGFNCHRPVPPFAYPFGHFHHSSRSYRDWLIPVLRCIATFQERELFPEPSWATGADFPLSSWTGHGHEKIVVSAIAIKVLFREIGDTSKPISGN